MIYRKLPDLPTDPATIVRDLRAIRGRMQEWQRHVKPFGTAYLAMQAIAEAATAMTTLLTGDRDYFMPDQVHGGMGSPLGFQHEKEARERGDAPWKRL